ncbi:MAG: 6-bladed beta-propeller [Cytophagales bacterium]|nr:6-bladed beta-propeller [Cytophagales bacterium]
MKRLIIMAAGLLLVAVACQQRAKEFEVDFTKEYDGVKVDLNDIAENLRIVRLDTAGGNYIEYFNGFVGKEYIIHIGRKKIALYSKNGKFIRTIAAQGRGPGEYQFVDAWAVDKKEQTFLYHDFFSNEILRYNLSLKQKEKSIPFESKGQLNGMFFHNDSTVAVCPRRFGGYKYQYFFIHLSGEIVRGEEKEGDVKKAKLGFERTLKQTRKHEVIYQPGESEVVYQIEEKGKRKLLSFILPAGRKKEDKDEYYKGELRFLGDKMMILGKTKVTQRDNVCYFDPEDYLMSIDEQEINRVDAYVFSDLKLSLRKIDIHQNGVIVHSSPALTFKDNLRYTLKKKKLSEEQRAKLIKLNASISKEENPILIVGDLK